MRMSVVLLALVYGSKKVLKLLIKQEPFVVPVKNPAKLLFLSIVTLGWVNGALSWRIFSTGLP